MRDAPRSDMASAVSPSTMTKEQQIASLKEEAQSMKEQLDKVMRWIDELENTERGPGESTLRAKQKREIATAGRVVIDEDQCIAWER